MDSATSNDTKMDGLEALFTSRRIVFDHNGNRVRYVTPLRDTLTDNTDTAT